MKIENMGGTSGRIGQQSHDVVSRGAADDIDDVTPSRVTNSGTERGRGGIWVGCVL